MRLPAGCKRRDLLVPDVQPSHAAVAAQGVCEAVQAIAHDPVNSLDAGGGECLDHLVGYSRFHGVAIKSDAGL